MTIEQIKNQMKDVNAEIKAARDAAVTLQADANATPEAMKAAMDKLETLKARQGILRESLDEETEAQSVNLKAMKQHDDQIRAAAEKFKSAGDFFNALAHAGDMTVPSRIDPRLADYMNVRDSASGQNLTTDADGGYLVPPDYAEELINVAQSQSVLYPEVTKIPVSGNRLVTNYVDTDSRKDHDGTASPVVKGRNGGLLAYWKGEAAELAATSMKFAQDTTSLNKLTGLAYVTDEMLEDIPAIGSILADGFRDEFAFKIDDAILNGTGSGQPEGILAATALVTIAKESGQAAASLLEANILKMFNAMPAANRAKAKWFINQDLEIVLYALQREITDGGLFPLFVPAGGMASAPNGTLLGRPIVPIEQAGAVGAKGDILFADLSQYRWIDKSGINAQTSIHVRFLYEETAFRFTYRAGGKSIWKNALPAYKGSTSRSPFVTLAART